MDTTELAGMPPRNIILIFKYVHARDGSLVPEGTIPDIGDPIDIPSSVGDVTKITHWVKDDLVHYEVTVTEEN